MRPASITDQRELSIITGTRAISGSVAMYSRNVVIASSESSMPSSMLTSMTLAPPRTCSSGHRCGVSVVVVLDQAREALRSRDVRALADHLEIAIFANDERLETGETRRVILMERPVFRPAGQAFDRLPDRTDVIRRRPAAAADDVGEAAGDELAKQIGGLGRELVVLAERVRQAGIRIDG